MTGSRGSANVNNLKTLIVIAVLIALVLGGMIGIEFQQSREYPDGIFPIRAHGIDCLFVKRGGAGGLSCDWGNLKGPSYDTGS